MDEKPKEKTWLTTKNPAIVFEDNTVGRLKKQLWDASEAEIDKILVDYGIPSEPELGKAGTYVQTTVRQEVVKNRQKNDVVIIPVGCTENHGLHTVKAVWTRLW
jgi:creatinine amidohydrolase